jgi:DNA replication protein DnaC
MNIAKLIAEARELATKPCEKHATDKQAVAAIDCSGCNADALVDPGRASRNRRDALRAMTTCDRRFPTRRRNSDSDNTEVASWGLKVIESPSTAPSLILMGNVGVGKTEQAYGAIRRILACRPKLTWEAIAFAEFTASLRPGGGGDAEHYKTVDLLFLDDLGAVKPTEWVEEITYRVVDARYEAMRPTIYATNCGPDELGDAVGERVRSRLSGCCEQVVIVGEDMRREK